MLNGEGRDMNSTIPEPTEVSDWDVNLQLSSSLHAILLAIRLQEMKSSKEAGIYIS